MPKQLQLLRTSYALKCGVNGASLYNLDVARVEIRGGTCARWATPSSLCRTCNDKAVAKLQVEKQSHRGLRWATSMLYNGVQFTQQVRAKIAVKLYALLEPVHHLFTQCVSQSYLPNESKSHNIV